MSRTDCICNRNIKIIAAYVEERLGPGQPLFEGLSYPDEEYPTPDAFFLNEFEWTTYENFNRVFRRARALVDEPHFYFNCGASTARLRSWGRFHFFARVFSSPNDGFKRLPFFNSNFNDTKSVEIILPPSYDSRLKMTHTIIKASIHEGFDPDKDFIRDPYFQGIISSIPTIWGLAPAEVRRVLNPYDPVVLLNQEPEYARYQLKARLEANVLTMRDPLNGHRQSVGEKVLLKPETVHGKTVFLGKHVKAAADSPVTSGKEPEAILITKTVQIDDQVLLEEGEIYKAPYYIYGVTYARVSAFRRLFQFFRKREPPDNTGTILSETITQLRKSIQIKNKTLLTLEKSNAELRQIKQRLHAYNEVLEKDVAERTASLHEAQKQLMALNQNLESQVKKQLKQLEKYNELRRYLSPHLTQKILHGNPDFELKPQRKMLTVVFTDMRGFSHLTDSLEPEEIFHLLDRYLSQMIEVVYRYEGTLDKIIGDGLLVFFGDPIPVKDHAQRAVRMAIDMQKMACGLKKDWFQYGQRLGIGMGINTGFVTVGNIGSDMHRDYTVIGTQVNLAARLEAMAERGQILVSQRTYSQVKDLFDFRKIGDLTVKGIHQPVTTYEVLWERIS